MKTLPIIAFAPHPWEENQWMNRQHILSRLAERGWPVFYCTGALDWWSRGTKGFQDSPLMTRFRQVDGVTLVDAGKLLPTWNKAPLLTRAAKINYCSKIKKVAGIVDDNFIFMPFNPAFYSYRQYLNPRYTHFHAYDLYWKMEAWNEERNHELIQLNQTATLVTSSSGVLAKEMTEITGVASQLLLNAADVDYFKNAQTGMPDELAAIPHPRVANIGAMNAKMDCRVLLAVATTLPTVSFVFVGRLEEQELLADPFNSDAYKQLKCLPNVYFIAEKSRKDIPSYMHAMDILTVCYRTDAASWAYAGFPLKLVEYLATGRPVVSSAIPAINEHFSNVVTVCQTTAQWVEAIKNGLLTQVPDTITARKNEADLHSWDARVDLLLKWYQQMLGAGSSGSA